MVTLGWLGGIFLAVCGIPEAYKSWKNKKCDIGYGFLGLWLAGEVFTLIYLFSLQTTIWSLILNYSCNILCICVMLRYKVGKV